MPWNYLSNPARWAKSDTGRETLIFGDSMPTNVAIRAQIPGTTGNPARVILFASADGRTCIECGVVGTDVVIRPVLRGAPGTAHDSAAHGLSNVPYTMEVRKTGLKIEVFLNGSTTAAVDYTLTGAPLAIHERLPYMGISGETGAVITRVQVCSLQPERSSRETVAIFVCDGNVWWRRRGAVQRIGSGVFKSQTPVQLIEYRQQILAFDGSNARIIDPSNEDDPISDWNASAGDLPGKTQSGTTKAIAGGVYFNRVVLSDEQRLFFSALDDPLDWDTAADKVDRAYGANTDRARVGQPVTALVQASNGALVIGCTRSIWTLVGDLSLGVPTLTPASTSDGISGPAALILANEGVVVGHGPDGLFVIAGGTASNLSQPVLSEGITIPDELIGGYTVSVARDPKRDLTHVFLTPNEPGPTTHFTYSERIGGWQGGAGGFFPTQFPEAVGPTAVGTIGGEVVLGTRDGRVLVFDQEAKDDDGEPIECRVTMLLDGGDGTHDVILRSLLVVLGLDSDPVTYKVYGGTTAEEALIGDERWLVLQGSAGVEYVPVKKPVRAPALAVELSNITAGTRLDLETVEIDAELGQLTTRKRRTYEAPGGLCNLPDATSSSTSDSLGSGPGDDSSAGSEPSGTASSSSSSSDSSIGPSVSSIPSGPPDFEAGGDIAPPTSSSSSGGSCPCGIVYFNPCPGEIAEPQHPYASISNIEQLLRDRINIFNNRFGPTFTQPTGSICGGYRTLTATCEWPVFGQSFQWAPAGYKFYNEIFLCFTSGEVFNFTRLDFFSFCFEGDPIFPCTNEGYTASIQPSCLDDNPPPSTDPNWQNSAFYGGQLSC